MNKTVFILLFQLIQFNTGISQQYSDYAAIFGKHYKDAEALIRDHPNLFLMPCKYNFDAQFCTSIIFPELIRYSNIRDVIETSNLKVLYIQFGSQYSDFSIGRFQMKPTFIESLEKDYNEIFFKGTRLFDMQWFDLNQTIESRKERVKRMSDLNWQMRYLMLFVYIMDKTYERKNWGNKIEKLRFYSTAYNSGYKNSETEIYTKMDKKFYKIGLLESETYRFSDICVYYYINSTKGYQ